MEFALYSKLYEEIDPYTPQTNDDFSMEFSSSHGVSNRVFNNLDHITVDCPLPNPYYGYYHSCYDPFDPFQGPFGKLNQEFSTIHGANTPFGHEIASNTHMHGSDGALIDLGDSRVSFQTMPLDFRKLNSPDDKRGEKDSCLTLDEHGNRKRKIKEVVHIRKKRVVDKKSEIIKGQWTPDEDRLLVELVEKHGIRKWSTIAQMLSGRIGKQCRERWHNHLKPNIKKDRWSEEEDKILIESHRQLGNKWAEIARSLPGRSENTIKNHWNATKRRQLSSRKNGNSSKTNTPLQNYIKSVISTTSSDLDKDCMDRHSSSAGSISPAADALTVSSNAEIKNEAATYIESFKMPPAFDADHQIHMQYDLQKEMDFMEMLSYGYI